MHNTFRGYSLSYLENVGRNHIRVFKISNIFIQSSDRIEFRTLRILEQKYSTSMRGFQNINNNY